jgi:hypothetical protein
MEMENSKGGILDSANRASRIDVFPLRLCSFAALRENVSSSLWKLMSRKDAKEQDAKKYTHLQPL